MSQFHYSQIEQQLVEALPEIRPAAEFYWAVRWSARRGRLKAHHDCWSDGSAANDQIVPEILDGYHVRTVIARELELPEPQVPGETYASGCLSDTPLQPGGDKP